MAESGTYRTTEAAVIAILRDYDDDIELDPFIEAANALVTEICADVASYDDTRLELIERWLSAFFYCIADTPRTSEGVDGIYENFQHREDLGFDVNHYGQQAMRLDTNGGLAALNQKVKKGGVTASLTWLGRSKEEHNIEDAL